MAETQASLLVRDQDADKQFDIKAADSSPIGMSLILSEARELSDIDLPQVTGLLKAFRTKGFTAKSLVSLQSDTSPIIINLPYRYEIHSTPNGMEIAVSVPDRASFSPVKESLAPYNYVEIFRGSSSEFFGWTRSFDPYDRYDDKGKIVEPRLGEVKGALTKLLGVVGFLDDAARLSTGDRLSKHAIGRLGEHLAKIDQRRRCGELLTKNEIGEIVSSFTDAQRGLEWVMERKRPMLQTNKPFAIWASETQLLIKEIDRVKRKLSKAKKSAPE